MDEGRAAIGRVLLYKFWQILGIPRHDELADGLYSCKQESLTY